MDRSRRPEVWPITSASPTKPDIASRFVPPLPPKTPKSASTRIRLLAVAGDLFVEHGYHAVSMRDVAAAAGLTKGALYGHFRSKGQLLVEVIRTQLAAREHTLAFSDALHQGEERAIELLYDDAGRAIRLLEVDAAAAARHDPDVAAGLDDLYRERQAHMRAAMEGVSDVDVAAWLISVVAAGIAMKQAAAQPRPDDARTRAAIAAALTALA
jgi:AcrR family transcriptional regulator